MHDPEKACPALDAGCKAVFPRDKREGVCAEIMLNQGAKARSRFNQISSRFSVALALTLL
jgi:hypothetical protein